MTQILSDFTSYIGTEDPVGGSIKENVYIALWKQQTYERKAMIKYKVITNDVSDYINLFLRK